MKQRTRTGSDTRIKTRKGTRAILAAGAVVVLATTLSGCLLPSTKPPVAPPSPRNTYGLDDPTGYPSDTYSPSPSPTRETFNPDGRADVRGSSCDFSNSLRQFTYTVRVTNPSLSESYSYDIAVNWMKAKPADGKAYGLHERSIVVRPGDTETYTAKYTVNQSSIGRFWYTCRITRAHKTRY
ncbi:hypothetical protein [Streptomyces halobius]|uniref:Ig-like domain-containing protein n=1 Tax=Streptomyces halobius TaxID=2879846 RepID=A0ABY4MAI0_9ACTN|nr:hypothetical protein [Streptomyces halobius]UQA94776.1 hypothetical protein K9S39_25565 [Streptomyces halobius]